MGLDREGRGGVHLDERERETTRYTPNKVIRSVWLVAMSLGSPAYCGESTVGRVRTEWRVKRAYLWCNGCTLRHTHAESKETSQLTTYI